MTHQKTKVKEKHKEAQETATAGAQQRAPMSVRGRVFEGVVTKKFPTRVVMEFERTVYIHKYQRFTKKKTRLHARLPHTLAINVGDYIKVRECRPLSKIIHFVVIEKMHAVQNKAKALTSAEVKA